MTVLKFHLVVLTLLLCNAEGQQFSHIDVVSSTPLDVYGKESLFSVAIEAKVSLRFVERYQNQEKSAKFLFVQCGELPAKPRNSFIALTSPCKEKTYLEEELNSVLVPFYATLNSKKWNCLTSLMLYWVKNGQPKTTFGKFKLKTINYSDELLKCSGLPKEIPRILPRGLTREEQIFMGTSYLNGKKLTIATINRPPFTVLTLDEEKKKVIGAKGFCIEMINLLSNKLNFTYELILPYDGNWGNPMANGTFNGMVGMVKREWADIAVSSFTITHIRNTVIDFTHPYYEEPTAILLQAPKEQTSLIAFLEPFSYQVWMIILASVLVVGPLLWVITEGTGDWAPILYPYSNRNRQSFFGYIWDTGFAITTQSNKMRLNESSRVLLGMWWIYCIILIYTYTGTLIASLTVPRLARIFQNLEEMASQREILWTYRANTAHDKLFASNDPASTYYKIGQLIREQDLRVTSDADGLDAVLERNMAFIKEKSYLDFVMERDHLQTEKCRFSQVPNTFYSAFFGWVLQDESIFLPLFNAEFLRMMQQGLFSVWRQTYWPKPNACTGFGGSNQPRGPRALRVSDLSGHFLIIGIGFFVAVVQFGVEVILKRILPKSDDFD